MLEGRDGEMKRIVRDDEIRTCSILLGEFLKQPQPQHAEKIKFSGVGKKDVYNITAPFQDEGELVIAGRVESRDSEHSQVYFFVEHAGEWKPRVNAPVFTLQDPFVTRIGGNLVFGGVEISPHPEIEGALEWRTVFYKGQNIAGLTEFFKGPVGMKDLRLVELSDKSVGVLTRPQGEKGGRGEIGFTKVPDLEELTVDVINDAPLLEGQFIEEEWGGGNEIHLLNNGLLGVLGHIACFDDAGDRHYYPMYFILNPENKEFSNIELVANRANFLPGVAKRSDLKDVVFSGGLLRNEDGTAELYAGIGDAEAQKITIDDPFRKFEG